MECTQFLASGIWYSQLVFSLLLDNSKLLGIFTFQSKHFKSPACQQLSLSASLLFANVFKKLWVWKVVYDYKILN